MIELLKILLSLSLSGTLLILILLLSKHFYKDRLSKQWQYYIWLVVVARLLLPFTFETSLVDSLFQTVDNTLIQPHINRQTELDDSVLLEIPYENQIETVMDGTAKLKKSLAQDMLELIIQNIWLVCGLIWIMVAIILLVRKITIYQSFMKYIKAGRVEVSDMKLWEQLGELVEQEGVKGTVELYMNSLISSPLLIGFRKPYIILPTVLLSDSDFHYTILHELTHYKRWDMFYKWLVQVTICFHWFNPFVYLLGKEISRACELSCDEAIIRKLDKKGQRAYGDTLLHAIGIGGGYNDSSAAITLNESAELLKERLDAIMNYQKKSKFIISMTLAATILCCAGAMKVGAYTTAITSNTSLQNITPWSAMGGTGQPYTYSQTGYYQGSYIFELGWNLNEKGYNAYYDKAELTLSDRSAIIISFDQSCKKESQDQAILADLKELIERLKTQYSNSANPLEKPLVISVKYVGDSEPVKLAEEYYMNDELTRFSAIFAALDKELQKEYGNRMLEDERLAFFSSCAKRMDPDTIEYYIEKAYEEDRLTFFSSLAPYLTDNQKQTWIARASRDDKNTFLSVLTKEASGSWDSLLENTFADSADHVTNNELVKLAEEYYTNDELTRFSAIFATLDKELQKEYGNRMLEDERLAFFSSCAKRMDPDTIEYYIEKAYEEDRLTFFSSLAPYLTDNQKQTWIARASRDDKNTFLSVLTKEAFWPGY